MDVEFDPDKDVANVKNHGLSLVEARAFDLDSATVIVDDRVDYGEVRDRAFGRIDELGYCLMFTVRPPTLRLISFRRAHEKEMRRHGQ